MTLDQALNKLDDLKNEKEWYSLVHQLLDLFNDAELEGLVQFQNDWMENMTERDSFEKYKLKFNEMLSKEFRMHNYDLGKEITIRNEGKIRLWYNIVKVWLLG